MSDQPARDRCRSFFIGIAGGSASGKSTFAAALLQTLTDAQPPLRVEMFSMDRYFRRGDAAAPSLILSTSGEWRMDLNHPESADNARLVDDILRRSHENDAPDVILVEGLMALHVDLIRDLMDLRLFIDLDDDVRALRRMLRRRGRSESTPLTPERLESGISYYRESARVGHALYVRPSMANADLIIRGDADLTRVPALIADIVHARTNHRSGEV